MSRRWWWIVLLLLCAAPARAQSHAGIRAGVSGDPSQFFFGGHVETAPLLDHLTFRPNVEIGFGDGLTVLALNIEFAYWIPVQGKPLSVYLGGGPAAIIASRDGESNAGGGFNIMVGAQHRKGLFVELKVGLADSPDVKFAVGYVFK